MASSYISNIGGFAAQGASIGTAINPGGGTAVGAVIGAGLGAITSMFGGSSSSGGGGFKKSDIRKALKANNEWEFNQFQEQFGIAIQAQEKAVQLYDDEAKRLFDQELQDYRVRLDIREANYNTAFDLYTDSVDNFYDTRDLNDISAQIAINDAGRLRNDRIVELGINQQQIFIQDKVFAAQSELTDSLIRSQMSSSIELANINAQSIGNQISVKTAEGAAELAQTELKKDDILQSLDRQIAEADSAQQLLRLSLDETRADAAIQTDQARRSGLLAESAQIAKGQAGRSAAKSVQGIAFQSEQAQSLIASAIVRADAKYLIDKNAIVEQLASARQQGKNQLKAAAIEADLSAAQMLGTAADFGLQLDQLSVNLLSTQQRLQGELASNAIARAEATAASALSLSNIDYAMKSAEDQYTRGVEGINFQKYQANLAAASQILDQPVRPPLAEPPTEPPPLVLDPTPQIDWKGLKKLQDQNRKAGMATALGQLTPQVNTLANNLQSIGNAALQVAEAFKQPPTTTNTDYSSFASFNQPPLNLNTGAFEYVQNNPFDFSNVDTFNTPSNSFALGDFSNSADINYGNLFTP